MKYIIILLLSTLSFSLFAKPCEFTWKNKPEDSKYTEQYSIKTNIEGHTIRIFKLESDFKDFKKNCEGLSAISAELWGYSDYTYKNGVVTGYWTRVYDDGSTMYGTWSGSAQSPKVPIILSKVNQNKNSMIISSSKITGGTGVYLNVKGYGMSKGEFNPGTGYISNTNTIFYKTTK